MGVQKRFDPWDLIAEPIVWCMLTGLWLRDCFISRGVWSKSSVVELELRRTDEHGRARQGLPQEAA